MNRRFIQSRQKLSLNFGNNLQFSNIHIISSENNKIAYIMSESVKVYQNRKIAKLMSESVEVYQNRKITKLDKRVL